MSDNQTLKLYHYGSAVLKKQAEAVTEFNGELRDFVNRMIDTLYEENGVGLAAPQVGVSRRIVVIDLSFGEEVERILPMINPEILSAEGECSLEEGCLSIPGIYEDVVRPERVRVRYRDPEGRTLEMEADGFLARVIQHESDHLDGILFVDRLGAVKRTFLAKALREIADSENGEE
ncbi:MAG: peptide deformylase [Candidatus Latescibacterota bacterium]